MTQEALHSGLAARDLVRTAVAGAVGRPLRAVLSILGIALGVAAMVTIVGISNANRAHLDAQLRALGPDLLTVQAGQTLDGKDVALPRQAPAMIGRIGPVGRVAAIGITRATMRRTDRVPEGQTGAMTVAAATPNLAAALSTDLVAGHWLTTGAAPLPEVVLGAAAARRLGITALHPESRVYIAGRYYAVVGILAPVPLAPEIDNSALMSWSSATHLSGFDPPPTTIYVRSVEDAVQDVRAVLAATANPAHPEAVTIGRPSDVLAAKAATDSALSSLVVVLAGIALLIGGIGVANTMIVAVLERRQEIGLRRALGARRGHITVQFLGEAAILALSGGVVGAVLGGCAAALTALNRHWPVAIPWPALAASLATTLLIGLAAGLYPALKAARQEPTLALTGAS